MEAAGLAVSAVGFAVAIWQIVLTRREIERGVTVAEATRDAIKGAEHLRAVIDLMSVIPQMQRLERDLLVAIREGKGEAAATHLQDWRGMASEIRGVVSQQPIDTSLLDSHLRQSSTLAAQAISSLDSVEVGEATKTVVTVIASVTEEAGLLMGQLKTHPGVTNGRGHSNGN